MSDDEKDVEVRRIDEATMAADAKAAIAVEVNMSVREALRIYPKAMAWSMFFSLGVIMLGFDPQVIGNLYGVPKFQRDFGYLYEGEWIISAAWQSGLSMGSPIGQVLGALTASYPMEWFGRKWTFVVCVVLSTGCVFIQFFARSLSVLLAGELLAGLVMGAYVVIAPAYASEVCPIALRALFTSYINICFVIGQFLANAVSAGTNSLETHWAYSLPFAIQWIWPALIYTAIWFAPESPYWLVRKGRLLDAEKALRRLAAARVDVKQTLAMIIETDRLEQEMQAGTTLWDCFNKVNRRRTEVSIGVYSIQVLCGIYLIGYSNYFFTLAGLPTQKAFDMGVGFLGLGFVGTLVSWFLLRYYGRRVIYASGLAGLVVILLIVGILDCVPNYENRPSVIWAQSSLMLVWNFVYGLSVGPVCFVIICETSATKVRSKTIAIATAVQALFGIVMTVAIPYMINPDAGNMRGKLGFFFGALAAICFTWVFFRVPETKGRSYEEIDIMYERNVPTREFKNYQVLDRDLHRSSS